MLLYGGNAYDKIAKILVQGTLRSEEHRTYRGHPEGGKETPILWMEMSQERKPLEPRSM